MKAWKVSSVEAHEESLLRRDEDDEAGISGGVGDATGRPHRERECGDGGSPRQREAVMQFFQGVGNRSSRTVTLVTLCVLVRPIAFCPPVG